MFWLFTMRLPGRNTFDVASEFKSVIEGTGSVSMVAAIFLQDLVHKDPLRRPTASDALESRWISETTGWEKEEMKSAKGKSQQLLACAEWLRQHRPNLHSYKRIHFKFPITSNNSCEKDPPSCTSCRELL